MKNANETVERIKEEARALGACGRIEEAKGWRSLARLMLSPQGVEFLQKHPGWPEIGVFRQYKAAVRPFGIYVDQQPGKVRKVQQAAFVGQTSCQVCAHGASTTHVFVVMHGATLTIKASNYAVVRLYNLGGTVTIDNDGTAKILE